MPSTRCARDAALCSLPSAFRAGLSSGQNTRYRFLSVSLCASVTFRTVREMDVCGQNTVQTENPKPGLHWANAQPWSHSSQVHVLLVAVINPSPMLSVLFPIVTNGTKTFTDEGKSFQQNCPVSEWRGLASDLESWVPRACATTVALSSSHAVLAERGLGLRGPQMPQPLGSMCQPPKCYVRSRWGGGFLLWECSGDRPSPNRREGLL